MPHQKKKTLLNPAENDLSPFSSISNIIRAKKMYTSQELTYIDWKATSISPPHKTRSNLSLIFSTRACPHYTPS